MRKRMYPVTRLLAAFFPHKARTLLERERRQKFAGKAAAHTLPRNDKSYQTLRDVLGIATTIQFAWILTVTSLDGIQYNICIMNLP